MTNDRGGSQPIDYAEVFSDPSWGGGIRYGLVTNVRKVVAAGGFDGTLDLPMTHRLLRLERAGAHFEVSTGADIARMIARDHAQAKEEENTRFCGNDPATGCRGFQLLIRRTSQNGGP